MKFTYNVNSPIIRYMFFNPVFKFLSYHYGNHIKRLIITFLL